MVTFRNLEPEEFMVLLPKLREVGWLVPYGGGAIVAEEEGEIVGFVVIQILPHVEPLWVEKRHRGKKNGAIAKALAERTKAFMEERGWPHYLAIGTNAYAEKLCEGIGMTAVEGKLYASLGGR